MFSKLLGFEIHQVFEFLSLYDLRCCRLANRNFGRIISELSTLKIVTSPITEDNFVQYKEFISKFKKISTFNVTIFEKKKYSKDRSIFLQIVDEQMDHDHTSAFERRIVDGTRTSINRKEFLKWMKDFLTKHRELKSLEIFSSLKNQKYLSVKEILDLDLGTSVPNLEKIRFEISSVKNTDTFMKFRECFSNSKFKSLKCLDIKLDPNSYSMKLSHEALFLKHLLSEFCGTIESLDLSYFPKCLEFDLLRIVLMKRIKVLRIRGGRERDGPSRLFRGIVSGGSIDLLEIPLSWSGGSGWGTSDPFLYLLTFKGHLILRGSIDWKRIKDFWPRFKSPTWIGLKVEDIFGITTISFMRGIMEAAKKSKNLRRFSLGSFSSGGHWTAKSSKVMSNLVEAMYYLRAHPTLEHIEFKIGAGKYDTSSLERLIQGVSTVLKSLKKIKVFKVLEGEKLMCEVMNRERQYLGFSGSSGKEKALSDLKDVVLEKMKSCSFCLLQIDVLSSYDQEKIQSWFQSLPRLQMEKKKEDLQNVVLKKEEKKNRRKRRRKNKQKEIEIIVISDDEEEEGVEKKKK